MIEGVGEALIRARPEAILAFVTDLERYKLADWKIGRVFETRREADAFFMRHDGKLRGVPGPSVALRMVVIGKAAARYHSVPTFPSRLFLTFEGGFELTETPEGTHVVHTERFRFFAPWRWIAEPFLRDWLAEDVRQEMKRLQVLLEAESGDA
jgi:hypothetical protein